MRGRCGSPDASQRRSSARRRIRIPRRAVVAQRHPCPALRGLPRVGRLHRKRALRGPHDQPLLGLVLGHLIGVGDPPAQKRATKAIRDPTASGGGVSHSTVEMFAYQAGALVGFTTYNTSRSPRRTCPHDPREHAHLDAAATRREHDVAVAFLFVRLGEPTPRRGRCARPSRYAGRVCDPGGDGRRGHGGRAGVRAVVGREQPRRGGRCARRRPRAPGPRRIAMDHEPNPGGHGPPRRQPRTRALRPWTAVRSGEMVRT